MKIYRNILILTYLTLAAVLPVPGQQTTHSLQRSVSIIRRPLHGVPTLFLNDKPFLVVGAQCDIWRSTRQDQSTIAFFDGYRDMNATTVSVGIPWSRVETSRDVYDFVFMDWFIKQAQLHGLKLVLNLFNSNVCGKVAEGAGPSAYPQYTPAYILNHPETFGRMQLPYPYKYADGGPPMCPNSPATLERERLLVTRIAAHLRDSDIKRTVIMLQLNNEFYFQQWEGKRPDYARLEERSIRCNCGLCNALWSAGKYSDGEEFMFTSFARYARILSDSIADVYHLPMYLNSPWWPPHIVPIFLQNCPNIDMIGIDGVLSPREPGIFSESQLDRNIPFAAENPTENSEVRLNLDVLPYYTLFGRPGIGNLLWECGSPHTVVDDPESRERYRGALYPIKNAMEPIAKARGSDRLTAWFTLREIAAGAPTDPAGNYLLSPGDAAKAIHTSLFIREGLKTRIVAPNTFETTVAGLNIGIANANAGVIVKLGDHEILIGCARSVIRLSGKPGMKASVGRYVGGQFNVEGSVPIEIDGVTAVIRLNSPSVVKVKW